MVGLQVGVGFYVQKIWRNKLHYYYIITHQVIKHAKLERSKSYS